jgi:hypothetical protein
MFLPETNPSRTVSCYSSYSPERSMFHDQLIYSLIVFLCMKFYRTRIVIPFSTEGNILIQLEVR